MTEAALLDTPIPVAWLYEWPYMSATERPISVIVPQECVYCGQPIIPHSDEHEAYLSEGTIVYPPGLYCMICQYVICEGK